MLLARRDTSFSNLKGFPDAMWELQAGTRRTAGESWKVVAMKSSHRAKQNQSLAVISRLLNVGVAMIAVLPVFAWSQRAPNSSKIPWVPDPRTLERQTTTVDPHEALIEDDHVYSLGELIDIAESNSPATRAAWNRAKMTAASVGIAKSELYPTIIAAASGRTYLNPELLYQSFVMQDLGVFDVKVQVWPIRL